MVTGNFSNRVFCYGGERGKKKQNKKKQKEKQAWQKSTAVVYRI